MKSKFELFNKDFSNEKIFERYLEKLFSYIFSNIFQNILNLPRIDFINSLTTTVKAILEDRYTNKIYTNQKFFSLFLSLNKHYEKKYNEYNQILSTAWDNYQNDLYDPKNKDTNKYNLTKFRKHCKRTQDFAIHYCNKRERGKFLIVYSKNRPNEIKFIICDNCRKSYYIDLFLNYCKSCNCTYYCGLLTPGENPNILPATYNPPHCEPLGNDKIICTKCKGTFYYNMTENVLQCINRSCKYKISPSLASFKCNLCSSYFRADIKIFNTYELLYIRKLIDIALLIKEKANPGILACCKSLELNDLTFYHKKECRGELYFWLLNQKLIVICEKCKALNYFSRFTWTCPNCNLRFRTTKEEFEEKIKRKMFSNLKMNLDMKILLGNEFLHTGIFHNYDFNKYSSVNSGYVSKRKKSFREVLNMKKNEEFKIENKRKYSKHEENSDKKKNTNEYIKENHHHNNNENIENIENIIYKSNSKKKLNEEIKTNMKKRKNYLYEKLLRNQFVRSKNSSRKNINIYKRSKSGAVGNSDQKNIDNVDKNEKENRILVSERKLIQIRGRSGSNHQKNKNINLDRNTNESNKNNINEKDDEINNKLNNSDDADKVEEKSFILEYNKKNDKQNKNKKELPPLPIRPKSGSIFKYKMNGLNENPNNNNEDLDNEIKKEINNNQNIYNNNNNEKIEDNNNDINSIQDSFDHCRMRYRYRNSFNVKQKVENIKRKKIVFNFVYTLGHQEGFNTPKIFMKNDLDRSFRKKYNKKNPNYDRKCYTNITKEMLKINFNLDLNNTENDKNEIKQKLEDKFNENYTQKKTKDKTASNEDEDKSENKEKEEENNYNGEVRKEDFFNKKKKHVKNNIIYYFPKVSTKKRKNSLESKYNVYNKINPISKSTKNLENYREDERPEQDLEKEQKQEQEQEQEQEQKQEQEEEIQTLNINQEKENENYNVQKNDSSKPDDIINASMFDSKIDIPIDDLKIRNNEELYNEIQRHIKKILCKGKLPQFQIDNYEIVKQIGEGSFGFIYQVINKKTKIKYAMKKIIANNLNALEFYQKEFEIVHQNSHENILDILGICIRCFDQTTYVLYVLMDLALYDWDFEIEQRKRFKDYYKEEELISILKQISSALFFLQKDKKIAHRDIKPENILVFKNRKYKLGDFGEAKNNKYRRNNARNTIRGTEMYMSPILFKSLQENKDDVQHDIYKSDVFSLGYCFIYAAALDFKIIYEIRNINNDYKLKRILQRVLFLRYSNDFIEILLKMICSNEEDRVDFIGLQKLIEEKHL